MSATQRKVAKLAGVSQSTVSRAFEPDSKINEELRNEVFKIAKQIGYYPNAIGQSLRSKKTNMIGLVIIHVQTHFYLEQLLNITNKIQEMGSQVLLFIVDDERDIDKYILRALNYQVDGLIIAALNMASSSIKICMERNAPVILLNRYVPGMNISSVCCDNLSAGNMAAKYLLGLNKKNILYVSDGGSNTTSRDRGQGFLDGLSEGQDVKFRIMAGGFSYDRGAEVARRLFEETDNVPEAVFFANDVMACGFMDVVRLEYNIRIPEDMIVIGFDDIEDARKPIYSLTTIQQPMLEMLDKIMEIIEMKSKKDNSNSSHCSQISFFTPKLIIRKSTGGI